MKGFKKITSLVLILSMISWILRFGLFGLGTPDMPGVLLFVLSCILYGIAFDFYNIAGSLYVEQNVDKGIRASAQGLFMMMSNGVGATLGMIGAGSVMDHYVFKAAQPDWSSAWLVFAAYMVVVTVLFAIFFKDGRKQLMYGIFTWLIPVAQTGEYRAIVGGSDSDCLSRWMVKGNCKMTAFLSVSDNLCGVDKE